MKQFSIKTIAVITCVFVMVVICFILSSCGNFDIRDYIPGNWDPHQGERPTDYVPSKWISEDLDIWFEVLVSDEDNSKTANGEIVLDDKAIKITVRFNGGRSVFIYSADSEGGLLLQGTCKFNPENLIVTVDKKTESLLNGQYDTITFVKKTDDTDILIFDDIPFDPNHPDR